MINKTYVTTAIPYVNAAPHLGYALELVQADVLARHRRLRGGEAHLHSGTDDNALKNVAAARRAGVDVRSFVAANGDRFAALAPLLEVEVGDFLRTGTDPRHASTVDDLWRRCAARGDFYTRAYNGLYCNGCEAFYTHADLDGGDCPEHGQPAEPVSETNWFFRLSRYRDEVLEVLESGEVRVEPVQRRNEVLAFLRAGLADISVSRPAARASGWGIPVPGDPEQVVYVWWDALANYVSSYGPRWVEPGERIHIIGKDIVRFHAVYWIALLRSAGLPLPTAILVHDFITFGGTKLAKSSAIAAWGPAELVAAHGCDAVRWWLLADVARVGDTEFSTGRLIERSNIDLANGIGNLAHRFTGIIKGYPQLPPPPQDHPLLEAARRLPGRVDAALHTGDFRAATAAILALVDDANRLLAAEEPWRPGNRAGAGGVLATLGAACAVLARELGPFLPGAADRLRRLLSGERLPEPLFPRKNSGGGVDPVAGPFVTLVKPIDRSAGNDHLV
jgi:methionyl-tRNA synthetase